MTQSWTVFQHPLDLGKSVSTTLKDREQQIYHLSSLALQTTGKEDESTLREDVDEEFCLV